MGNLLQFLELAAIAVWLGSAVFFTFLAAPTLRRTLGADTAGPAVRALYSKYCLLGMVCGVALSAVYVLRGVLYYWGGMIRPSIVLFALLTAMALYGYRSRSTRFSSVVLLCLTLQVAWMAMRGY